MVGSHMPNLAGKVPFTKTLVIFWFYLIQTDGLLIYSLELHLIYDITVNRQHPIPWVFFN